MSLPPGFPERGGFADMFSDVQRRLAALERSARLTSASIGSGGLTVKDGGAITILDSLGNPDVVLNSDGLEVIGGFVTPIWIENLDDSSQDTTITTSGSTPVSVTFNPPSWVQEVKVFAALSFQMSASANHTMRFRIDIDGLPGTGFFSHSATSGETSHVTRVKGATVSGSGSFDVDGVVSVSSGSNSSNVLRLTVQAVGFRTP